MIRVPLGALTAFAVLGLLASPAPAATKDAPAASMSGNYLAGHVAQRRGDFAAAATFLGNVLKADPTAPDVLRRAFLYNMMDGRMKEALELARRLNEKDNKNPQVALALAVDDAKNGKWDLVEKRMAALDNTGLNAYTSPLIRAWAAMGKGNKDAAIENLKPLANLGGTKALHDIHAALIYMLAGDLVKAEQYLLALANEKGGITFRSARLLGNLYERQGKTKEAKAAYEMFLKTQPKTHLLDADFARMKDDGEAPTLVKDAKEGIAEALYGIASSLNQDGGHETSLVLGRLGLYLKPSFPILSMTVGSVLESLERPKDAIAVYKGVPAKTPFHRMAQIRIAHNLDQIKQTDEAIKILKATAKENAADPSALVSLGDLYRRKQKWPEAVAAYDDAVKRMGELDKSQWQILYTRAIVLERNKQWDRAEQDFLKALEFEPDQPLVLNYLGYSWIEQRRNLEKALNMIKTAVKKRPRDGYITDSLGWAYYQLGDLKNAVPELERAVELRPEDPVINDHLGDAYWKIGRKREATFQWNHALSLKPEDDVRAKIEEKLKSGLIVDADEKPEKKPNGG